MQRLESNVQGKVVNIENDEVKIKDCEGLNHIYRNLNTLSVDDGQSINIGDEIGLFSLDENGKTHLYYEVCRG